MDEFVQRYGAPYNKFQLNSGDIAYDWKSTSGEYHTLMNGATIELSCEMQLVTDRAGVIRRINLMKDQGLEGRSKCLEVLG